MVQKKTQEEENWLVRSMQRINEEHPILETRFFVVEVTPPRKYHDGYDYCWSTESRVKVSPFYLSVESAQEWMDAHEPDDGKYLEIMTQDKRRTITDKWWSARKV